MIKYYKNKKKTQHAFYEEQQSLKLLKDRNLISFWFSTICILNEF